MVHKHTRTNMTTYEPHSLFLHFFLEKKIKCQKDANTHTRTHMHAGNEIVVESHISSNSLLIIHGTKRTKEAFKFRGVQKKMPKLIDRIGMCLRACV